MALTLDVYDDALALAARASKVFQPRTPITTKDLFAGRWGELTKVSDAVNQPGLHVVIYGERGVGKTSLANVVRPTIRALDQFGKPKGEIPERLVIKSIGTTGDTFSTIWDKLLSEITWPIEEDAIGLTNAVKQRFATTREAFTLKGDITVDNVRRVLAVLPGSVFIIDEFDRTADGTSKQFTDLIKTLSDLSVDCTVIIVGVSETVGSLVADHESINRALVQIPLPRMKAEELRAILTNAEKTLEVEFSEDAATLIVHVSQGLPHYTHLIGLHALRNAALKRVSPMIERTDVLEALKNAVKEAEQTVTQKHSTATHSSHKDALYRQVLLACALAAARSHDPLGYFNPSEVVEPLNKILKRDVTIATFTNHLGEFSQDKRGKVLEKDGQPWGFRYRFHDPLLVPFAFMNAVEGGLLSGDSLVQMLNENV
jgi:Cdc6-like AAA superfamily ATPase